MLPFSHIAAALSTFLVVSFVGTLPTAAKQRLPTEGISPAMPRTGLQSNGGLEISVFNLRAFHPGDRIDGQVLLKAGYKAPSAVQLEFSGRLKTKFVAQIGNSRTICRGRAPLLRQQATFGQFYADAGGGISWPFTVTIPYTVTPLPRDPSRRLDADDDVDWPQSHGFLSSSDDVEREPLPSVFCYYNAADADTEGYVEYALACTAADPDDGKNIWRATFPLLLRTPSTEQPIEDFGPHVLAYRFPVQSSQLAAPAPTPERRSFGRRLSQVFKSPSQKYTFRLYLQSPGVIQLGHPRPLEFKIWTMPIIHPEFTNIDPAQAPPVAVTAVSVSLKSIYRIRAPAGGLLNGSVPVSNCSHVFTLLPTTTLAVPLLLAPLLSGPPPPSGPAVSGPHANAPPGFRNAIGLAPPAAAADLGAVLDVAVHRPGPGSLAISPSMRTWSIAVEHTLLVTMEIACADKTFRVPHEAAVRVLAAPEVQMRAVEDGLGAEGMRKNYDDLALGAQVGMRAAAGALAILGLLSVVS